MQPGRSGTTATHPAPSSSESALIKTAALSGASASLSKDDMAKVKDLRAKGEKLHKGGNHSESVEVLGKAKENVGHYVRWPIKQAIM